MAWKIEELWGTRMFTVKDAKFSEMKNKPILDRKNQEIGRIIDFHFKYEDGKVNLKSIVMGGSRIEEFLESIGVRPDIDPFFPLRSIDRFEDGKLYLNVDYKKLDKPIELGKDEARLSDICKLSIIDSDKNNIGNVIDVVFDNQSRPWFVIGGGFFEEFSERIGLRPDIDLLLPQEFITNISADKMTIKYSKYQLSTTAEKEWEKHKRELTMKPPITETAHRFLWLGEPPRRPIV